MATMCSVCGDRIGGLAGGGKPLSPEHAQTLICGYCNDQLGAVLRDPTSSFAESGKTYLMEKIGQPAITPTAQTYLEGVLAQLFQDQSAEQQKMENEMRAARDYRNSLASIQMTSGHSFEGWRIVEYTQFISSELVVGMGIIKDLFATFANIAGTRSGALTSKLASTKEEVIFELRREAHQLGCNAIIGVDLEYTMFGDSMVGVILSGTAVKIEPAGAGAARLVGGEWGTAEDCQTCNDPDGSWGAPTEKAPAASDAWGTPEKCESCDAQGDSWGTPPK